jgi:hypothetical protein
MRLGLGQPTVWSWANGWAKPGDLSLIEEQVSGTRMYVKPGGNVGIGTQNVPFKFVVDKGQTVGDGIAINGTNDTRLRLGVGQATVWSWANGWAVPGDLSLIEEQVSGSRIYVKPGGNVGINTSNPTATFEVNGTAKFDQPVTFAPGQMLPSVSGNVNVSGEIIGVNGQGQAGTFSSTQEGASGLVATGGSGTSGVIAGIGIVANGGAESNGTGGIGVQASGGSTSTGGTGGIGVQAKGGDAYPTCCAGPAIVASGGSALTGTGPGGAGVNATGGHSGGAGILSTGGFSNTILTAGVGVTAIGGESGLLPTPKGGSGMSAAGGNNGDGINAVAGQASGTGTPLAGSFTGNVNITGTLTSGVKDFRIDHPLDPANKYLYHASVESSEMINLYTGNAMLDASGRATVQLPTWFQSENADFRYQLTAIGASAPGLYIAQEVQNGSFSIAGGHPGLKVSWQITAVRQDRYARAHPLVVESPKPEEERGYFLHPELFNASDEKGVEWARHPELMKRIKEMRAAATRQRTAALQLSK